MKSSAEEVIIRLKNEYSSELEFQPGQKKRKFSTVFKEQVCSQARSNNIRRDKLARELGISESAIRKWLQEFDQTRSNLNRPAKALFQKLEVESEIRTEQSQLPYVIGRAGVRVMGLTLGQMAELLRCL